MLWKSFMLYVVKRILELSRRIVSLKIEILKVVKIIFVWSIKKIHGNFTRVKKYFSNLVFLQL